MTVGERYDRVMAAADQAEADEHFSRLVPERVAGGMDREDAEALAMGAAYLARTKGKH